MAHIKDDPFHMSVKDINAAVEKKRRFRRYKKEMGEAKLAGMKRRTPSPEFNLPTKKPTKRNH